MISVAEDDRNVLRFLWFHEPFKENSEVIELRFTRVTFGLSSSPFLLNATLKYHITEYQNEDPEFVEKLLQSLYVDDIATGDEDEDETYRLYMKLKLRLAKGGFNARKFVSNSKELQERIERNEKLSKAQTLVEGDAKKDNSYKKDNESFAKSVTGPQNTQPVAEKLLGVQCCTEEDCFVFDCKQFIDDEPKEIPREVVRMTSRIYDPVGYITPLTVRLKIFCQSLCKKSIEWDEPLDQESSNTWKVLQREIKESELIKIPRCYFNEVSKENVTAGLEGFSDSSVKAYAAVVYLKLESKDGVQLWLVASKTRVTPLVVQSIPRLELLSALILSRLIIHAKEALKGFIDISYIRCWSDSEVVLYSICGETREWKQFVQNRVLEIRSLVPPEQWNHCVSKDNPADILSRGATPTELKDSMWFTVPEWKTNQNKPTYTNDRDPAEEAIKEL